MMRKHRKTRRFVVGSSPCLERLESRRLLSHFGEGLGRSPSNVAAEVNTWEMASDRVLVHFKPGTTDAQTNDALQRVLATSQRIVLDESQVNLGRVDIFELHPGIGSALTIQTLSQHPAVDFVEPDWIVRPMVLPNDPQYTSGNLWGLYGEATSPSNRFGSHAAEAWAAGNTGSNDVYIAVIDTGIDFNHPDLRDNLWVNPDEIAGNGQDNDGNGYPDDVHGWDFYNRRGLTFDSADGDEHGTHVAGTIGAVGNNGVGVVGMNWNIKIITAKFLGPDGGYLSDAIEAIDYITRLKLDKGLNIVATNNSWGGGGWSESLERAINRAAQANILFVAAAGNNGNNNDTTPFYPANYTTTRPQFGGIEENLVLSVAAINSSGNRPSWSNYGAQTVHIGAPGVSILSTMPGGGYGSMSGTSMAAPHVTGAVALFAAADPSLTAAQIRDKILTSARSTSSLANATITGGRLDVSGAVPLVSTVPDEEGPTIESIGPVTPTLRNLPVDFVDVVLSKAIEPSSFTSAALSLTLDGQPLAIGNGVTVSQVDPVTYRINELTELTSFDGTYELIVSAAGLLDLAGNPGTGEQSTQFQVDRTAPWVQSITINGPDLRNTPLDTIDIEFSESIVASSFTTSALGLTLDGQPVPLDGLTITPIDSRTYRISGFENITIADGSYVLTVQAADVMDLAGNSGIGGATASFVLDTTPPTLSRILLVPEDSLRGSISFVDVEFSKAIVPDSFSTEALKLSRDGQAVSVAGLTITPLDDLTFRITGLLDLTDQQGDYQLTVDARQVVDKVGNLGVGLAFEEFSVQPNSTDTDTNEDIDTSVDTDTDIIADIDSDIIADIDTTIDTDTGKSTGTVLGDYDGDGEADLALYQYDEARNVGRFHLRLSNFGSPIETVVEIFDIGPQAIPITGDFDGDGKTDVAVVDPFAILGGGTTPNATVWIILLSGSNNDRLEVPFGAAGHLDRPAPADYDGDGITDIATFRANSDLTPGAAEWFILRSRDGALRVPFGAAGGADLPAPADYTGDGKADIATFRPVSDLTPGTADWFILPSDPNRSAFRVNFGASGGEDQPVVLDYDGDGKADIAAFRSRSDLPDADGQADTFLLRSRDGAQRVTFGIAGSIAAFADYDGDGLPDLAVFDPAMSRWTIRPSSQSIDQIITFGSLGSVPVLAPLAFRLIASGNLLSEDSRDEAEESHLDLFDLALELVS